ncbi:MAG: DUF6249 domain-containing protein [Spirosomataceae bacterium]
MRELNKKIMDSILRDFIVGMAAIAATFGILYVLLMTRHRERMSLMERGLSPKDFNNLNLIHSATLKYGLLCIGIALGIMTGNFIARHFDVPRQGAFIAMIFLFGGTSLIISYFIEQKNNHEKYLILTIVLFFSNNLLAQNNQVQKMIFKKIAFFGLVITNVMWQKCNNLSPKMLNFTTIKAESHSAKTLY